MRAEALCFFGHFFWLKKVTSNKKNPYKITYKHAAICLNKNKSLFTKLRCNVRTLLGETSHAFPPLAIGAVKIRNCGNDTFHNFPLGGYSKGERLTNLNVSRKVRNGFLVSRRFGG